MKRPVSSPEGDPSQASNEIPVDLALQGGGAHGAFAWGVLDRLLDEPWLRIDGISGTSAGAMNAAVLSSGFAAGGATAPGRRSRVSGGGSPTRPASARFSAAHWMCCSGAGPWITPRPLSPWTWLAHVLALRPEPDGANPLRDILADSIDFGRLAQSPITLFVTATNVRTGRPRVFRNAEMSPDALLASACLPTLYKAVEIDGETYWDGGYSGNPTISPLVRECSAHDTILVQINPVERPGTPRTAQEIQNRLNEISFNSPLLKELRMIALLRQVADPATARAPCGPPCACTGSRAT